MAKKITLKDIAVSRALTRTGKISKENEMKIFDSAHKLNYPISTFITPVDLRRSINIALVTKHYTGEFFASLFEGFDKATKNTKARINLISISHTTLTPEQIISDLKKSRFDAAVFFLPDYKESDYVNMIKNIPSEFPLVSIAPIANPRSF